MSFPLQIRASWRREEVALWNWFVRHAGRRAEWQTWIAEAFADLLQVPAGSAARVVVTSGQQPEPAVFPLRKQEVFVGRDPENDIVLASQAITKRHARLWEKDGELYFEDLGSTLGTFAGEKKLKPHEPHKLTGNDRLTIFPYTLTVEQERLWKQEGRVEVSPAEAHTCVWRQFRGCLPGMIAFPVTLEPGGLTAVLEVSREFLAGAVRRVLYPAEIPNGCAGLLPYDRGLVEFLLVAVLERANRELAFPFRLALQRAGAEAAIDEDASGISVAFLIRLPDLAGAVRLFLPYRVLEAAPRADRVSKQSGFPISWRCSLVAGEVELLPEEAAALDPGDVAMLTPVAELRLPGAAVRGWCGTWQGVDRRALVIERYCERKMLMPNEQVDLSGLPVTLHVVLGEKELTLAELSALEAGSIVELDRDKSAEVSLALNGRAAGTGELVEIDGRLGVRIVKWSKP